MSGQIRLGTRAFLWLGLGLIPALLAPAHDAWLVTVAFDLALVLLFLIDARLLSRARLEIARSLPARAHLGSSVATALALHNHARLGLRVWLRDDLPVPFGAESLLHTLMLAPESKRELPLSLVAQRRGHAGFDALAVRIETRLGLAARRELHAAPGSVRVLPAVSGGGQARRSRRDELGSIAQRLRRASQGSELESLREYVSGDPLRAIDWKAAARRQRPITRLYQAERSQTLWLVLDASRTMAQSIGRSGHASPDGPSIEKTRFDVALETALALAHAALHAGDQVGALVYADTRQCLVAPGRGPAHYGRLLDALGELQARPVHFAVRGLFAELERHARKRALVVLFTDLENEVHAGAVCEHAPMLTRRHLSVCVSLEDAETPERANLSPQSDAEVFRKAAAIDLLDERRNLERRLSKRGVVVLQADARGLAQSVLDHYLEVKLKGRL